MHRSPLMCAMWMACTSPPTLQALTPKLARPGSNVAIEASTLPTDVSLTLGRTGEPARDLAIEIVDPTHATALLPDDLPAGVWQARLQSNGRASEPLTFEVWTPESEPPCHKRYTLEAEALAVSKQVLVDRHGIDGISEHLVYKAEDIAGFALTRSAESEPCDAIWLERTTGERVLLADDHLNLTKAAQAIANGLQRPLKTPDEASK